MFMRNAGRPLYAADPDRPKMGDLGAVTKNNGKRRGKKEGFGWQQGRRQLLHIKS